MEELRDLIKFETFRFSAKAEVLILLATNDASSLGSSGKYGDPSVVSKWVTTARRRQCQRKR
jgi:hypothetical protein